MFYKIFESLARWTTAWAGSTLAFVIALAIVFVWITTGPIFQFTDTWQLVINTGTTIVTFLMVFLLQRAQNKDSQAIQMKLNELIAAHQGASNRLLNIEHFSEEEIENLQRRYHRLSEMAYEDDDPLKPHTVEEIHPSSVTKKRL